MSIISSDEVSHDAVMNMHNIMIENETYDYMNKQNEITKSIRCSAINWLFIAHECLKKDNNFSEETYFRTISIFDRF
jgi:hypothetical protein